MLCVIIEQCADIKPTGASYTGATYKFTVLDTLGRRRAQTGEFTQYIPKQGSSSDLQSDKCLNQDIKPWIYHTRTSVWAVQTITSKYDPSLARVGRKLT